MNQNHLAHQVLQFQKTTTDNCLRSANLLMEHGERLNVAWLDKCSLLPGQTRDAALLWLDMTRTWRSYCHASVNALFDPFEPFSNT